MDQNQLFVYASADLLGRLVQQQQQEQKDERQRLLDLQLHQEKLRQLQATQALEAMRLRGLYAPSQLKLPTALQQPTPAAMALSQPVSLPMPTASFSEELIRQQQLLLLHALHMQALAARPQPSPLTPLASPFVTMPAPPPTPTTSSTTSLVSEMAARSPDTTPSPSNDSGHCTASPCSTISFVTHPAPAPSPKNRARRPAKEETEVDEEALFIDVESVDERVEGKDRRKAHIEFYRRLKSIRQREKKLTCALCFDVVDNYDNALRAHVHSHATQGCFRCQLCGWETHEKNDAYKHSELVHPGKKINFEDRRDMARLSQLILECFPKTGSKMKQCYLGNVEKLTKSLAEKGEAEVECLLCQKPVGATKNALLKHTHAHPTFRCKHCKYTCESSTGQEEHCREHHGAVSPRLTVDFNLCSAADVMSRTLSRCFGALFDDAAQSS